MSGRKKPTTTEIIAVTSLIIAVCLAVLSIGGMIAYTAWEAWQDGRIPSAVFGAAMLCTGAMLVVSICANILATSEEDSNP